MSYAEKLRDPRWQKKRLEIYQRDNFACRKCGSKENTLNLHHNYYENGLEPWEYPNDSLVTLCENCHAKEQENMKEAKIMFVQYFLNLGCISIDLHAIMGDLDSIIGDSKVPLKEALNIIACDRNILDSLYFKYHGKKIKHGKKIH